MVLGGIGPQNDRENVAMSEKNRVKTVPDDGLVAHLSKNQFITMSCKRCQDQFIMLLCRCQAFSWQRLQHVIIRMNFTRAALPACRFEAPTMFFPR
jgi:hypothetical protein